MTSVKLPQAPETYDEMFRKGGDRQVFRQPYRHSCYYPMFRMVLRKLKERRVKRILEVGCGTGGFAHMILDDGAIGYRGFDFSPEAVRQSAERTGREDLFYVADATLASSYADVGEFDGLVCTEVLEHVPDDIGVISHWPPNIRFVATVPNFDSPYHVRFFVDEEQVRTRYGAALDIEAIARVKKPYLADISLRNYLRELRWNRYRPQSLRKLLGFGSMEEVGCWFVMSGTTRSQHYGRAAASRRTDDC